MTENRDRDPSSPKRHVHFQAARQELLKETVFPQEPRQLINGVAERIGSPPTTVAKAMMGLIRSKGIEVRYFGEMENGTSVQAGENRTRQLFLPGFDLAIEHVSYQQIIDPKEKAHKIVNSRLSPLFFIE